MSDADILELLTKEFPPPHPRCEWIADGGTYIKWSQWTSRPNEINGLELGCGRVAGWWTFGWAGLFGRAPTLLAAIADFRARVAAEAAAVGALPKAVPVPVERWQAVSLNGYSPSDASDPAPRGWEPVSVWEPVANNEGHVLWQRRLRRVEPQKAEV